jgi:hypothetical protein
LVWIQFFILCDWSAVIGANTLAILPFLFYKQAVWLTFLVNRETYSCAVS